MGDVKRHTPVILVGDQGNKAAAYSKNGMPCFLFPDQSSAEQWRGCLNAIDGMKGHKLRVENYDLVMEQIVNREEKLHALAISIYNQVAPSDQKAHSEGVSTTAWRLAKVLRDCFESNTHQTEVRDRLIKGLQYV